MIFIRKIFPLIVFFMTCGCLHPLRTEAMTEGTDVSKGDHSSSSLIVSKKDEPTGKARYIQDFGAQDLDFAEDVTSWEELYQVTAQLKRDLLEDEMSFTVAGLKDKMLKVLACLVPESGVYHYLRTQHMGWFEEDPANPEKYPWRYKPISQENYLQMYRNGAEKGYARSKQTYYSALFYRNVWDARWSDRLKILKEDAEKGDPEAKYWVANAIAAGKYIFEDEPSRWDENRRAIREKKSFKELTIRAENDTEARRWLYAVMYQGRLGQSQTSDKDRFSTLLEGEKSGDPVARRLVDKVIYHRDLGQKPSSDEAWLTRLLEREAAQNGAETSSARRYVNRSLLHGFDVWKKREGFKGHIATLREREAGGDKDAGRCISKGLYDKKRFINFVPYKTTPQERYAELAQRAKKGDWHARDYVCRLHNEGDFGQQQDSAFADALFRSFVVLDLLVGTPPDVSDRYTFGRWDEHNRDIDEI